MPPSAPQTPQQIAHALHIQLAEQLLNKRSELNLSQARAARRAGLSQPYLDRLEKGLKRLNLETLVKWTSGLDYAVAVELTPLVDGEPVPETPQQELARLALELEPDDARLVLDVVRTLRDLSRSGVPAEADPSRGALRMMAGTFSRLAQETIAAKFGWEGIRKSK